jgi:hypothetical protein
VMFYLCSVFFVQNRLFCGYLLLKKQRGLKI